MSQLSSPVRRYAVCGQGVPWASSSAISGLQTRVSATGRVQGRAGRRIAMPVMARTVTQDARDTRPVGGASLASLMLADEVPVRTDARPGLEDNARFQQDWSVQFWRNFRVPEEVKNENLPLGTRVQAALRELQQSAQNAKVFESTRSIAYWTYHLSRTGFFSLQGVAGVAYFNFLQRRRGDSSAQTADRSDFFNMSRLLSSGIYGPLTECLGMFYQDYENIKRGIYKMPWDFATPGHRQTNPLAVLDKSLRFFREAGQTLKRRSAARPDGVWLESGLYPDYYMNTWHYQTDGWLSEDSAKVYEISTETVFVGRQDAMQRQSLVPLRDFMLSQGSADGAGMQLLEIGSGTGRFATFVKDNYPRLGVTQVELSPFYLLEARKNMDYWRRMRGGAHPEDTAASKDRFLQAPGENIPVQDGSYDSVVSVYLFHELPEESRRKVISEMARVLKPGGMAILTDGFQLGDRPVFDPNHGNFQAFNEPNWGSHIAADYGALFAEYGLEPHKKVMASSTKVLSFIKTGPAKRSGRKTAASGAKKTKKSKKSEKLSTMYDKLAN